jgi:DNA-3-methyladenine glycosylase II
MFGLQVDLAPFYRMASQDAKLLVLVEKFWGVKPPRFLTIFETLANAFACQQLSLTVGLSLLSRLDAVCGLSLKQQDGTHYAFPRPQDLLKVKPSMFRKLGFSGNKVSAFHELARGIVNGRINFASLERMASQAVIDSLLELRGVGRWTAEYVLLRGLRRLDVFPGDDIGDSRDFPGEILPDVDQVLVIGRPWFRTPALPSYDTAEDPAGAADD